MPLSIDDDVLAAAVHRAERGQRTAGEVISMLARLGLSRDGDSTRTEWNGTPLLASNPNAIPVTLELVGQLRDDLP